MWKYIPRICFKIFKGKIKIENVSEEISCPSQCKNEEK